MKSKLLKLKKGLENKLQKDIRKWHKKIVARLVFKAKKYGSSGVYQNPVTGENKAQLEQILKDHYIRAEKEIQPKPLRKKSKYPEIEQVKNVINDRIERIALLRGKVSVKEILKTLKSDIAFKTAEAESMVDGDNTTFARTFRKMIIKKLVSREQGITITETNWIVEDGRKETESVIAEQMAIVGTKWIDKYKQKAVTDDKEYSILLILKEASEREDVDKMVNDLKKNIARTSTAVIIIERLLNIKKKWNDIGDSHTRDTHRMAGAQSPIEMNKPFLVGASMLMFPGDTSLGASLDEIIGCRCYLTYS